MCNNVNLDDRSNVPSINKKEIFDSEPYYFVRQVTVCRSFTPLERRLVTGRVRFPVQYTRGRVPLIKIVSVTLKMCCYKNRVQVLTEDVEDIMTERPLISTVRVHISPPFTSILVSLVDGCEYWDMCEKDTAKLSSWGKLVNRLDWKFSQFQKYRYIQRHNETFRDQFNYEKIITGH